jgi:calcineurin-like phosphoesterase
MTGALDSIIGMKREGIIKKFLTGINQRFEVEKENLILDMTLLDIDPKTGCCQNVEAIRLYEASFSEQL